MDGEEVDQATYEAYVKEARAAELAQGIERDRLIHQSAQAKLYELVNLNNWHDWLDVDAVNARSANNACWTYNDLFLISLNRAEIDYLVRSSVSIVSAEGYGIFVDALDGNGDDYQVQPTVPEWSVESECRRINAGESRFDVGVVPNDAAGQDTGNVTTKSQGGALAVWLLLMLAIKMVWGLSEATFSIRPFSNGQFRDS